MRNTPVDKQVQQEADRMQGKAGSSTHHGCPLGLLGREHRHDLGEAAQRAVADAGGLAGVGRLVQPRVDLVHDGDEVLAEHVAQGVHLRDLLQDPVEPIRLQRFHNLCQFLSVML
jgi:hypothetical protein